MGLSVAQASLPVNEMGRRQGRLRHHGGKRQLLRLLGVPLLEALDTARRIDKLLRARKERMALRADADTHVFSRGTRFEDVATRAVNYCVKIFWMYLGFHGQGRETYTTSRSVASRI
jgi:hypothetical protein